MSETDEKMDAISFSRVVCLLLINRVEELPHLAIESILNCSSERIVVGYLKDEDIEGLPRNSRITYLSLKDAVDELRGANTLLMPNRGYVSFDEDLFFFLVQVKWILFKRILENVDALIYSDLDVIWLDDVASDLVRVFDQNTMTAAIVQDFSYSLSETKLCMGVFAVRKGEFSMRMLEECAEIHRSGVDENRKFSDDDAISLFYDQDENSSRIAKLPNQSYPVGNLLNLLLPISVIRGLRPRKPMVFHANFVVGQPKKVMLLHLVRLIHYPSVRNTLNFAISYLRVLRGFLSRKFSR